MITKISDMHRLFKLILLIVSISISAHSTAGILKKLKKTTNSVSNSVQDAADDAVQVAADAKADANALAVKAAAELAKQAEAARQAAAAAAFAAQQRIDAQNALSQATQLAYASAGTLNDTYDNSAQAINNAKNELAATFSGLWNQDYQIYLREVVPYVAKVNSQSNNYKAVANNYISSSEPFINSMVSNVMNIRKDPVLKKRVDFLLTQIRKSKIDSVVLSELNMVAQTILPPNRPLLLESVFGLQTCVDGAVGVGVAVCEIVMINAFLIDGVLHGTTATSVSGSIGLSAGGGFSNGVFWAPGSVATATGGGVGLGVSGSLKVGVGVGLGWGVEQGMSGPLYAIPGINIDLLIPAGKIDGSIGGGYTWKGKGFSMPIYQ